MGIYGMVIHTSSTVNEALARSVRFQRLMTTSARIYLESSTTNIWWIWSCNEPRTLGASVRNEIVLPERLPKSSHQKQVQKQVPVPNQLLFQLNLPAWSDPQQRLARLSSILAQNHNRLRRRFLRRSAHFFDHHKAFFVA
jgi:Arabinose-binding domain of AraC transcription regulator, N-term